MGQIYYIKSPSGKGYIGQAVSIYSNGKPNGAEKRYSHHMNNNHCKAIHAAFKKYGEDKMIMTVVKECSDDKDDLTYWEDQFMKFYNTLSPNGYNLREAGSSGKMTLEAKHKLSVSLRNSDALKRANSDPEKKKREIASRPELQQRKHEFGLPKHVHFKQQPRRENKQALQGYSIDYKAGKIYKSWFSTKMSLDEKRKCALDYYNQLVKDNIIPKPTETN